MATVGHESTRSVRRRDPMLVAIVVFAVATACTSTEPASTAPPSTTAAPVEFPSARHARDCEQLRDQLTEARAAAITSIRDIDDLLRLDDEPTPPMRATVEYLEQHQRRYQQLECGFLMSTEAADAERPDIHPANRAQEMALAPNGIGALPAALRFTRDAMAEYHQEYDTYPTTIGELRTATRLTEPADDTVSVEVVTATRDSACVKGEVQDAPHPIYLALPEEELSFEPCT